MLETNFNPQRYTIHYDCPIPWLEEQESKIGADYPFTDYIEETLEEYIIQRYLETLWLPDSITCLSGFVHNLRRIRIQPDVDPRHLFDPLLLSVEAIREKYHVQLPRVLQDDNGGSGGGGGGNGEGEDGIEETMMWFAYGNERHFRGVDGFEASEGVEKEWFTKMEYREMKIQILLCLHILSLQKQKQSTEETNSTKLKSLGIPSTPTKKRIETTTKTPATTLSFLSPMKPIFPPTESMTIERERQRGKKRREKKTDSASAKEKKTQVDIEERLELLMDRLSIAQLMANLQTQTSVSGISTTTGVSQPSTSAAVSSSNQVSQDAQRDWMQVFCEDIVKPLFQDSLPTFYTLLHSKVFSHSSFSDESDSINNNNNTTLPPTLILRPQRKFKAKEKRPAQQPPSPLKLHEVAKSRGTLVRAASAIITGPGSGSTTEKGRGSGGGNGGKRSQTPQLSYPSHRSRSVSISVEEVRARGASRGGVASSKALFQGEFEMRRSSSVKSGGKLFQSNQTSRAQGSLLSKSQPHPPHPPASGPGLGRVKETNKPKTLVFDTPVKKLYPSPFVTLSGASPFVDERDEKEKSEFVMGDEFQWSSEEDNNNALNVNSGTRVGLVSGRMETQVFVMDTPVKSRDG